MLRSQELARVEGQAEEGARVVLLATAAARGDEDAFADLYNLLSQRVFNLVLRSVHDTLTAEDVCQEIWLRAHAEIRHLKAPEAFRSWLYRIASHACIDFARSSRGKHRNDESSIDEFIVAYGPQPEDTAILGSEVRMVWETLGSMAPRQSLALYLKQVEGLSYDEIAAVLDCSRPTVEALLFRARQSFVRTYHRVESSPEERCEMFSQVMASIIDNEPTAIQRSALESHAADCTHCRAQLVATRKANRAYLALPLLPIGKGLALEAILAGGGSAAGSGIVSSLAGLLGAGAFQAKAVLVGSLIVAGGIVASGQVEVPVVSDAAGLRAPQATQVARSAQIDDTGAGTGSSVQTLEAATPEDPMPGTNADPTSNLSSSNVIAGSTPAGASDDLLSGDVGGDPPAATRSPSGTVGPGSNPSTDDQSSQSTDADSSTPPPGPGGETGSQASPPPASGSTEGPPSGTGGEGGGTQAGTQGPLGQTVTDLTTVVAGTLDGVGDLAGETLNETAVLAGDTLNSVVQPVATVIQPVDTVVEDLTGLSVNETVDDVLNALPSSSATPVPLDETVEDVLEPVGSLVQDPLQPVEELIQNPVGTVEDLTGALLNPLQPPTPTPAPQATATSQSGSSPTPEATATQEPGPCLLGLLFC